MRKDTFSRSNPHISRLKILNKTYTNPINTALPYLPTSRSQPYPATLTSIHATEKSIPPTMTLLSSSSTSLISIQSSSSYYPVNCPTPPPANDSPHMIGALSQESFIAIMVATPSSLIIISQILSGLGFIHRKWGFLYWLCERRARSQNDQALEASPEP